MADNPVSGRHADGTDNIRNPQGSVRCPPESRGQFDLVLIQTCIASYRDRFIDLLIDEKPSIRIFSGDEYFDDTVKYSQHVQQRAVTLRNRFFLGRRFLWQSGAFAASVKSQTAVLELNPRIISNWAILLMRRLLQPCRKTFLWGHAWSRRGRRARSWPIRSALIRLSDGVVMYTDRDKQELQKVVKIVATVATNAVVARRDVQLVPGAQLHTIQIGRLVDGKRPLLTLAAWAQAYRSLPSEAKLVYVGDGPLRDAVVEDAKRLGVGESVVIVGHQTDPKALEQIFADCLVSVNAGYTGLALTHSLAYGVPAIVADEEPHAPEIAVANPSNSLTFRARDASALAEALVQVYGEATMWRARRDAISQDLLESYSVEQMVSGFLCVEALR